MIRFGLALLLISCSVLFAQDDVLDIPYMERPPTLEDFKGMKPGANVRAMAVAKDFVQRDPINDGTPTQKTEVYLGYDDKRLYAIFLAFDSEPDKIRARMVPREEVFDEDAVNIQIDSFNDQRRGFTFLSTAQGIQWDARWTEGSGFDDSYQAVWESAGELTDQGYMVRIAIPFSTLRFPATGEQVWGVMLNRRIPRLSEENYWPRYSRNIQGRLNQAGKIKGIKNISPGRNIMLNPYVFARGVRILNEDTAQFEEDDFDPDAGLDAKMVIKDSFVLDLTANPDFSQVESDEPQVTVNQRFEVFFEERRPFFLENADFFSTPTNLVFTRRIVDPKFGARFTGKRGKYGVGVMLINDEAPGKGRAESDPLNGEDAEIAIARVARDIGDQSTVGVLYTSREFGDDYNRVGSIDARIRMNDNWNARLHAAGSQTREGGREEIDGSAINMAVNRDGRHLSMHNHLLRTSEDFRTRLGFLRGEGRPGVLNLHNQTGWTFRPEEKRLISWGPAMRWGRIWDTDGETLDTFFDPQISWEWPGNTEVEIAYSYNEQSLRPEEFSELTFEKKLAEKTWQLEFESNYFSSIAFEVGLEAGEAINFVPSAGREQELADSKGFEVELVWRPISPLQVDLEFIYTDLEDQTTGNRIFKNEIGRMRGNWQFTRELSLRTILQYESTTPDENLTVLERDRNFNTDLLLRYVINPWTAFYLGYNSNSSNFEIIEDERGPVVVPTLSALKNDGRQYFLKFSYLFRY